jgi:hypothetical protein
MTNRDAAVLAFKLLALWLLVNAAISLSGLSYYWDPQFERIRAITLFSTLLPVLIAVGVGVPLWMSADWFAARTFPAGSGHGLDLARLRIEPLFALALSVIGALLVCEALPALVNSATLFTQSRLVGQAFLGPDDGTRQLLWDASAKGTLSASVTRLLLGLGLLAGPARLSAAVARIRGELTGPLADEAEAESRPKVTPDSGSPTDEGAGR